MSQISADVLESTHSQVMGLTLNQLKIVARHDTLQVSGSKAVLQKRIKERLNYYASQQEGSRFFRMRHTVEYPDSGPPPETLSLTGQPTQLRPPGYPLSNGSSHPGMYSGSGGFYVKLSSIARLLWKASPFYDVKEPVTPIRECPVRESSKESFEIRFRLLPDVIDKFAKQGPGENLRLMVYCTTEPVSPLTLSEIAFPQSIEVKVNNNDVKANLRGLKNKPGSTRPADITDMVHKRSNYTNTLSVTYALTHKKFFLVVNLIDRISPEALVNEIKSRQPITKDQVLHDMDTRAQDPDIQATSTVLSLKCPLSTLRMVVPCRSNLCTHNQCYDALSFLQLQEQAPTWTCPICSKVTPFKTVTMDGYVSDILQSSSQSVEQVVIEPNGRWSPVSADNLQSQKNPSASDDGDDDDLIEIQEPGKAPARPNLAWTMGSVTRTTPESSREQSIASVSARSSGSKRPVSAVIDLTISSDDEEPPRPLKRQSFLPPEYSSTHAFPNAGQNYSGNFRAEEVSFSMNKRNMYPSNAHHNPLGR